MLIRNKLTTEGTENHAQEKKMNRIIQIVQQI